MDAHRKCLPCDYSCMVERNRVEQWNGMTTDRARNKMATQHFKRLKFFLADFIYNKYH